MYKKLNLHESIELSNEAVRVQQGLSQVVTDLDTRVGAIMNKSKDPVLRAGLEDIKLKAQNMIGDFARAVPLYEENKAKALANSIDQAKTKPEEKPAATSITPSRSNVEVITEADMRSKVKEFMMEGWTISKPENSYDIEAAPFSTKAISKAYSILPKSAGFNGGIKIVISMVEPEIKACYGTQLSDDEKELSEESANGVLWTNAVDSIKSEILKMLPSRGNK